MYEEEAYEYDRQRRQLYYDIYHQWPRDDEEVEFNEEDILMYQAEQKALNGYSEPENNEPNNSIVKDGEVVNKKQESKDWNEYTENTIETTPIEQVALDFVKRQAKLEILETNDWWLDIPIYYIEYQLTKFQQINLIEEYILRCIYEKDLKINTVNSICDVLKLDKVFVNYYLQKMIISGQIIKNNENLATYDLTNVGLKALETGEEQVALKTDKVCIAYKPSLGIQIYNNDFLQQSVHHLKDDEKVCNYELPLVEDDELTIGGVNSEWISTIAEKQGREFAAAGVGSTVLKITKVTKSSNNYFHLGEVWLHDALNLEVTGKIWDFQQKRWLPSLEKILPETKKVSLLNDFNNRIKETKQKELKSLLAKQTVNEKTKVIETLRGLDIRTEFLKCFNEADREMIIISPWINDYVVDDAMLKRFQNVVNKGAALYIGWGIAKNIEEQDKKPSDVLLEKINTIVNKEGYPAVYIYYIGNHHDKEVLVDEKYHMLGSFNWLSYRGEHNIRHESVNKIYDKGYVLSQRKVLESAFLEVLEHRLEDKECFSDINDTYRWFGAIIHLQEEKKKRKDIVLKAINDISNNNPEMLRHIITMYKKYKEKDFGFNILEQKWNEYNVRKREDAKKNMVPIKELVELLNCSKFDLLKVTKKIGIKNISAFSKEDAEKIIEAFEKLRK